jgi:hypothetical protein
MKKPRSRQWSGAGLRPRRWELVAGEFLQGICVRPFSYPIGVIGLAVTTELRLPGTDTAGG